jgi:hypothetical protein
MKRWQFIATLFGCGAAAKAQVLHTGCIKEGPNGFTDIPCPVGHGGPSWQAGNGPINNECPVCGTMAEPFIGRFWTKNCRPVNDGWEVSCDQDFIPEERTVRCKRCNVLFEQDSEKGSK